MIKITIAYPNEAGKDFDMDYYLHRHIANFDGDPLVKGILVEEGKCDLGGGDNVPYRCLAHIFYNSMEDFQASFSAIRSKLIDDMKNFTTIPSTDQISQVVLEKWNG